MNGNFDEINPTKDQFGVHPMKAFAIATVSGSLFYYNYLRNNKTQGAVITATAIDADFVKEKEQKKHTEKDISRPDITACTGAFNLPPPQHRPYSQSMGVQRVHPNDLILIDNTYRPRLAQRRHLLISRPNQTYGSIPAGGHAVSELHTYLFAHHLPRRYPSYFELTPSGALLQNKTSSNTYPIIAQSPTNALRALGENLDEDFVILTPDNGDYRITAFVYCFPASFDLSTALGKTLSEVHKPLPGDGTDLMPLIKALKPGVQNAVCRFGWGITRTSELFAPNGGWDDKEFDAQRACLRVERLTVWKLPQSGAVVMGSKTYMTPLREIKKDAEDARNLIHAIETLHPDAAVRKGAEIWGDKVCEYLRS